jgi:hypothetical protein
MAKMQILVPEATTNYIENPAFRNNFDGWIDFSLNDLLWDISRARFGIASCKITTSGASISEGMYYRVGSALIGSGIRGVNDAVTVSAYVRGAGQVRIRLSEDPVGKEWASQPVVLRDDRWTRISVTGRCSGSNDVRLYVETFGPTKQVTTFWLDGAQMEIKPYATSYCDGTRPGCRWNGLYDASTSSRSAYTREGGRWVMIAGPETEQDDIYMTVVSGLGVAPITNNRQSYALSPGGFLDNVKINERPISLVFHVKHKVIPRTCKQALSLNKLHELRQMLIDIVKPDATGGNEPFLIEYQDGDVPLYLKVFYDGGLEGDWDIRNQWVMDFPLKLLATSPMFVEDNQENAIIDFQDNAVFNGVAGRINGEWNNLNCGISVTVYTIAEGKNGEIYAVTNNPAVANNCASAIDPLIPGSGLVYWNGVKWTSLLKSITGSNIITVSVAPNGDVYIGGIFSSVTGLTDGAVAADNIAKYSYSEGTWSALGAGVDDSVSIISIAPNGDVYAGGSFHNAGGAAAWHIARWDGIQWRTLGAKLGLNDSVNSIAISKDGNKIYVGGTFTDDYSDAASEFLRVAEYNITSNIFLAVGGGLNNEVKEVKISPAGYLYAAGSFTTVGITPFAPMKRIVKFNGSAWEQLANGVDDGTVYSMSVKASDNMTVVGTFTSIGDVPCKGVALWNGSTFVALDIQLKPGTVIRPYAGLYSSNDIFIGSDSLLGGSSIFSGITYITNEGTAEVRPTVYIKGSGTLVYLENQSTGKRIWFNLNILASEEIFIDFGMGKFYSTVRGDLFAFLLPGSDFHGFTLVPGVNKIAAFMRNDTDAYMSMYYTPTHHSVDATQHGSSF